jgi:hypothetical protein
MKLQPWSCNWSGRKQLLMSPSTPHAFAAKFIIVVISGMGERARPGVDSIGKALLVTIDRLRRLMIAEDFWNSLPLVE